MKQLILTISPQMWEEYKTAVSKIQGHNVNEEQAERISQMDMWAAIRHTIDVWYKYEMKEGKNE